jgi:hypothetical protein
MRKLFSTVMAVALWLVLGAGTASARPAHFLGPHPIATKFGGGYCYIEGPHIHIYPPDHPVLYHDVDGELVFTGDPSPFGYEGPRYKFYGHHPVPGMPGDVYCYLDGPHVHVYAPPETPDYRVKGDVAFYVGPFAPVYYREQPHREKQWNVVYRPYVAVRPVVEVQPPPEWHGTVWVAPPAVEVSAPGVVVAPPMPSVEVHAPGVFVAPPVVAVPGPPSVHVQVGVPAPVVVAPAPRVVVGAPPPVYVAPGVVEYDHYEHDRGKHKGWYKHRGDDDDDQGWKHEDREWRGGEGWKHGRGKHHD